jgi:DNA polymerase III alpha subunit
MFLASRNQSFYLLGKFLSQRIQGNQNFKAWIKEQKGMEEILFIPEKSTFLKPILGIFVGQEYVMDMD